MGDYKDRIGKLLFIFGLVMAIISVVGGAIVGITMAMQAYYGQVTLFLTGLIGGLITAGMMMLIAGFGKMMNDIACMRAELEKITADKAGDEAAEQKPSRADMFTK